MKAQYETVIKDRDTDPYILLAGAIIKEVVEDLKHAIICNNERGEQLYKNWLLSEYGQLLSLGQSEYIISQAYKTAYGG